MKPLPQPIRIFLVEDNEGDIVLTKEALKEGKVRNEITVARDGAEAIQMMEDWHEADNSLPDLILLDVNLPKMNGHEVLARLKQDHRFRHVPIVMLTTSSAETDIAKSYENHANCYITKPVELGDFFRVVAEIDAFWFNIVQLPYRT